MDLAVVVVAFGTIFVVELPDKTFVATLVLTTRYRPLLVWLGVGLAFAAQTAIAVGLGSVAGLLPETAVRGVALLLFLTGGILLLWQARSNHPTEADGHAEEEAAIAARARDARDARGVRAVLASFAVLFAAEWGDLSQLLTLSLAARYEDPAAVFAGAWGALLTVSGLAVLVGRALLRRVRVRVLHAAGGVVCLGLAALTAVELLA